MNPEIVKRFNVFRAKTGKYADLELDKVEFEIKTIGSIETLFKKGRTPKYSDQPTDVVVIKSGQARGYYNNFDFSQTHYLEAESIDLENERNLRKGDILINTTGKGTAGRVTLFDSDGNYVVDSHIAIFRFDHSKFYPKFLFNYFVSIGFDQLENMATGSGGQIELGMKTLKALHIPIPKALNEQYSSVALQRMIVEFIEFHTQRHEHNLSKINRIGAMWDKVESLVLPLTFAKEKSAAQRFNIFCQKNGYELKLEEVEFEGKELRELVELPVRSGGTPDTKTETYWADNSNIIDNKNYFGWRNIDKELFKNKYIDQFSKTITKMGFNSSSTWLVPENSILIAIASASKGLLTINRKPMCTNQNILGVVLSSSYLTDYVYYVLKDIYSTLEGKREYGNLTKGSEERRRILLPKKASKFDSFKLQNIIAEFFEHYLDKVKHYKDKVALLNQLIPHYNQAFITTTFNAMKRQAQ